MTFFNRNFAAAIGLTPADEDREVVLSLLNDLNTPQLMAMWSMATDAQEMTKGQMPAFGDEVCSIMSPFIFLQLVLYL